MRTAATWPRLPRSCRASGRPRRGWSWPSARSAAVPTRSSPRCLTNQAYGRRSGTGRLQMMVEEFETLTGDDDDTLHTGRIVPMHPATEGLSPRVLRTIIAQTLSQHLDGVSDLLPDAVRSRLDVPPIREALRAIHFPTSLAEAEAAHHRLAFDELLILQLGVLGRRQTLQTVDKEVRYAGDGALLQRFVGSLPYELTRAQHRVLA